MSNVFTQKNKTFRLHIFDTFLITNNKKILEIQVLALVLFLYFLYKY